MFAAGQIEHTVALYLLPQALDARAIAADQIVDKALEIGRLRNVHRRTACLMHLVAGAYAVDAAAKEFVKHVVFIGRYDEAPDRQTHAAGDMTRAHVAEIA